jgi:hypothetical protein
MKIYLKKKIIASVIVGAVLFVGSFILILSFANKNKNYAVDETMDDILNSKENEHMNMFNNDDIDADYDQPNNKQYQEDDNDDHIDTSNKNNPNEIQYNEEIEELESKLNQCDEDLKALQDKLNSTLNENTKKEELMESFAYKFLSTDIVFNNFVDIRQRAELHTMLWRKIYGDGPYTSATPDINDVIMNPSSLTGDKKLLAILHKKLYPWLYEKFKSPSGLLRSFKGRGIVICTGSFHFRFARSTVDTLRNIVKTKLPIEIMYVGESDLSEKHRKELESFENVFCTDVTQFFDNDIIFISGFAVKPFAALASRFSEVILIDADATYIHDPAEWFEDEEYKKTGTLFFKDRTLYPGPHRGSEWIHEWMVEPSEYAKNTRFYQELSAHEMESSTIVINKNKRFLGMLLTCKFNEQKIRDRVVYQNVFGDKETYWMAFEMANEPYSFIPHPIIYIGEINYGEDIDDKDQKQLCGHIGHTDRNGRIMFWNDHIIKDKHEPKYSNQLLRFEGWFYEDLENVEWTDTFHCANIKDDFPINEFTQEEKDIIKSILDRELEKKFVLNAGNSYN